MPCLQWRTMYPICNGTLQDDKLGCEVASVRDAFMRRWLSSHQCSVLELSHTVASSSERVGQQVRGLASTSPTVPHLCTFDMCQNSLP